MDFTAVVEPHEKMRGLEVPDAVVASLGGGARARVLVTVGGHTWSTALARMQGRSLIGVAKAHREAAGLVVGESVTVSVELDPDADTVQVPADVGGALASAGLRHTFDARTVSQRRHLLRVIDQAKQAPTRARRIEALVNELRA
ncbi:YdeI/OmpD-associated family protein [Demequina sp. NBRC 110055]|uniref:YdeI/OmpD-associated family protein n=1 Tax=Demequina sp. NBRC 110055 TaxID=1570344 RepID=UPI000A044F4A|nr:YdeI/OmpD-associated family protein [Demequina sp. NBRC 110055]